MNSVMLGLIDICYCELVAFKDTFVLSLVPTWGAMDPFGGVS